MLYLNQGWKETEPWIDKAHGEIGHSGEFHRAVDVSVDLSGDCASGLVNDCVHLGRENENRERRPWCLQPQKMAAQLWSMPTISS